MTEEAMLRGLRQQDEKVIQEVILKYSKLLWPIVQAVLHNVGSIQDAEECVADVFIQLWQQPEGYDPGRGSLKTWLCLVARSKAIDRYRSLSRNATLPLDSAMMLGRMGLQEALLQQESRRELRTAVNSLPDGDKDILIRRYYYEQKPRQIALALGLSVKQVDNSLYRSKQKLKTILTR